MIRLIALVAVSLGLTISVAGGQTIGDPRCKDASYTAQKVREIKRELVRVADAVVTVPAAEAEYLRLKSRKALEQNNQSRFAAIYSASQLHEGAKVAFDNLNAAETASGRNVARYLVVVLSRIGELQEKVPEYLSADRKRAQPMTNEEIAGNMYFFLTGAKAATVNLLQCVISTF